MDAHEERKQLDAVTRRLASRFAGLPPEVVADTVRTSEAGLREAVIRDFVPLLVEKEVRDRLAALVRQAEAAGPQDGGHRFGTRRSAGPQTSRTAETLPESIASPSEA